MILLNKKSVLKEIKTNGISAKEKNAKMKINLLMEDYVSNSSYRKRKIIELVKSCAEDYFKNLPDELVENELAEFYWQAKKKKDEGKIEADKNKTIILYVSEMKMIEKLQNEKLMRLAFAALILNKWLGQYEVGDGVAYYKFVRSCEADVYRLSGLDNQSGTTKKKLWQSLTQSGYVQFSAKTNKTWKFRPDWTAMTLMNVCFNVDGMDEETKSKEEIFRKIENYSDVMLYLSLWLNDPEITECADCGIPIKKSSNAKRLCADCAEKHKKSNKKDSKKVA